MGGASPGMAEKLAAAARAAALHAARGFPQSTLDVIEDRLDQCLACPNYNQDNQTCEICGCWIASNAPKVTMADQHCPDEPPRWPRTDTHSFDFPRPSG
jgi:hypothetical protein